MSHKRTRFAVVRSLPRALPGSEGWGSAMALAVRGEGTQHFLVAERPGRVVAIATHLNAEAVSALPRLLEGTRRTPIEDTSIERIILDLFGFDPHWPLTQSRAGDPPAIDRWATRPAVGGSPSTGPGRGKVTALKVFGSGSWSPHQDPRCAKWLRKGFDLVEFCLAGRGTDVQRYLIDSVIPGWAPRQGWVQDQETGRWAAGDGALAGLVGKIRLLVTGTSPVRYVANAAGFTLVGHLTINVERTAITLAGFSRHVLLEVDTCLRLASALREDDILAAASPQRAAPRREATRA